MSNDITQSNISIFDVFDTTKLQEIQDNFANNMLLAAIITNDQGNPVTKASYNSHFCQMIRSTELGNQRCEHSDSSVSRKSMLKNKQIIHRCHAGLVDAAAPIVVNEQHLGSILCGQVLFDKKDLEDKESLKARIGDLDINFEEAFVEFGKIKITTEERFSKDIAILALVANYITEIGVKALVEKQYASELRKMELKLLENQLNPHFLFNALNTVTGLAYNEGAENTQTITFALAELLRNNINASGSLVKVSEELEQVKNYLTIQEIRFGDRLIVHWKEDKKVDEFLVPILTIQTIVENAIIHGMEPREEKTDLFVHTYVDQDEAVIEVEDNGCGMDKEALHDIMETNLNDTQKVKKLGLHHIRKRLQYYYGTDYSFSIKSKLNQGTRVTIRLPDNFM